jgi:hypothetical protein
MQHIINHHPQIHLALVYVAYTTEFLNDLAQAIGLVCLKLQTRPMLLRLHKCSSWLQVTNLNECLVLKYNELGWPVALDDRTFTFLFQN